MSVSVQRRLESIVGRRWVTAAPARLRAYARDAWPRGYLLAREGKQMRPPDLVVWPGRTVEVASIVKLCHDERVPLIPYGAGSGVCGGTYALHGGVTLDLKRIDFVGSVQPEDRLVEVGAGSIGQHFEDALNRQGFTAGHFPSSISCSTVGGWIAARGAGQCSSRYGKIEDMVSGLTWVDGAGRVRTWEARPRAGVGPDVLQTVIGSEGVLGVITEATLRVKRTPSVRRMRGLLMPSVEAGLEAMRQIFAAGLRPAVLRLYDPLDTMVNRGKGTDTGSSSGTVSRLQSILGFALDTLPVDVVKRKAVQIALRRPGLMNRLVGRVGESALLIMGTEGVREAMVEYDADRALEICIELGGKDLGPTPGEHWLQHRHKVSYKISPMLDLGAFVDTMEVATTWDRIYSLYQAVRSAVREDAFIMAHFSHGYEEGGSVYFTFSGWASDLEGRERAYDRTWQRALEAVVSHGATMSHHHGIGMSKQAFIERELGGGLGLLRSLKQVLDPHGIMNPGKLGLGDGPMLPGRPFSLEVTP